MQIILASQSPRRRELLGQLGMPFVIRVADVDEAMDPALRPYDEVARVSRCKALAVSRQPEDIVIAADTIVVCCGQVLGKPRDTDDARRMLSLLSGRDHQVMTGLTVLCGGKIRSHTEVTDIHFRALTPAQIDAYIATGEPMDKAGSYAIQGGAGKFADKIVGDFNNVIGLPVDKLRQMLQEEFL